MASPSIKSLLQRARRLLTSSDCPSGIRKQFKGGRKVGRKKQVSNPTKYVAVGGIGIRLDRTKSTSAVAKKVARKTLRKKVPSDAHSK